MLIAYTMEFAIKILTMKILDNVSLACMANMVGTIVVYLYHMNHALIPTTKPVSTMGYAIYGKSWQDL